TMAMRASGSNDILLDSVFVPDGAISARRPKGAWTDIWNVVVAVAAPLVTSAYLGVAEAARDLAIKKLAPKREDSLVWQLVGEMWAARATTQPAAQSMVDLNT